jgi:hypothetical protein
MLIVVSRVPTKTRLRPLTLAILHPCPIVTRSPFLVLLTLNCDFANRLGLLTISLGTFLLREIAESLCTAVSSPVRHVMGAEIRL